MFRAHQFGAVATRKRERGKGLSRLLMDHILSLYPDIPAFLYANPSVINYYPRFGFRQAPMFRPGIAVAINNSFDKAVKYGPDDEFIVNMLNGGRGSIQSFSQHAMLKRLALLALKVRDASLPDFRLSHLPRVRESPPNFVCLGLFPVAVFSVFFHRLYTHFRS
jgi:hypothetical protein